MLIFKSLTWVPFGENEYHAYTPIGKYVVMPYEGKWASYLEGKGGLVKAATCELAMAQAQVGFTNRLKKWVKCVHL